MSLYQHLEFHKGSEGNKRRDDGEAHGDSNSVKEMLIGRGDQMETNPSQHFTYESR